MQKKKGQALRRTLALTAAAAALLFAPIAAGKGGPASHLSAALLQLQLSAFTQERPPMPLAAALTCSASPLLQSTLHAKRAETPPPREEENSEGTLIEAADHRPAPEPEAPPDTAPFPDNGVTPRTIHPTAPGSYLVWDTVYIANSTDYAVDMNALMKTPPAARLTEALPQVLIVHTHGTEAYTMPKGQEYETKIPARSHDTRYNVVRVGDEVAAVFEDAGISVLHDRTLHDAESYNGSYAHAEAAIDAYLQKYPSIRFVFDIHRDAIEDSEGHAYKVISPVNGQNAAQVSLVVGSDGSGLAHPHWRENLRLAALIQQRVNRRYPTLMRPMYLRNSRYNEHETTGSLLVEIGAAGNSLDEALYAARLFAAETAAVLNSLRPS